MVDGAGRRRGAYEAAAQKSQKSEAVWTLVLGAMGVRRE